MRAAMAPEVLRRQHRSREARNRDGDSGLRGERAPRCRRKITCVARSGSRLVDLVEVATGAAPDVVLEAFLEWVADQDSEPYPAQEEAFLELMADRHVILATPTGSGKSSLFNALVGYMREQHAAQGFAEVTSPQVFSTELFKISGHYGNFKDEMFLMAEPDGGEIGLKPMNCPGHCLIFRSTHRSY